MLRFQHDTSAESFIAVIGLVVYPVSLVLTDWLTGHSATKYALFAIGYGRGAVSPYDGRVKSPKLLYLKFWQFIVLPTYLTV